MDEQGPITDTQRINKLSSLQLSTIRLEEERLEQYIAKQLALRAAKTTQLEKDEKQRLPFAFTNPYGLSEGSISRYTTLPVNTAPINGTRWLVEMVGFGGQQTPVGIEIVGDVVMGVLRPGLEAPDLDLSPYQADEKGVSRRHAVIRPSRTRLYLIDLQSTNGSRVNAIPVGSGVAMELRTQDTVSLGALTFTIRILAAPADFDKGREMPPK